MWTQARAPLTDVPIPGTNDNIMKPKPKTGRVRAINRSLSSGMR